MATLGLKRNARPKKGSLSWKLLQEKRKQRKIDKREANRNTKQGNVVSLMAQLEKDYAVWREFKPLKVGIHWDMIKMYEGTYSGTVIRSALWRHTVNPKYQKALESGSDRFELNGFIC